MIKEIKGKNIILREQVEEDAGYYAYWYNQPDVMFKCGFTSATCEQQERETILRHRNAEDAVWYTITDLEGNRLGEAGLLRMFPEWHCTDLSIILPDSNTQRKGYGTEAIQLMLKLAFEEYEMNRISIGVVGLNTAAIAFYTKVGFKQEGVQEQGYFYNNQYSDFVMMRILRSEWESRKA